MGERRLVVIDDDHWKRTAMAATLEADRRIDVVAAVGQDEAVEWPLERWSQVDLAVVDVFDENAPGEVGTDVFSGVRALHRIRDLPVRTFAITPHCQHPLIQLRIHQANADWLYHRWEVNDPDQLVAAVLDPDDGHAPRRPADSALRGHGAHRADTNRAVEVYKASPLAGTLRPAVGIKSLGLSRREVERFRIDIARTGFVGTEERTGAGERRQIAPRWPDVRDYLLTLLGRHDTPSTEVDRDDDTVPHRRTSVA